MANKSALAWNRLFASSEISKRWCAVGVADYPFMFSGIPTIIFPI